MPQAASSAPPQVRGKSPARLRSRSVKMRQSTVVAVRLETGHGQRPEAGVAPEHADEIDKRAEAQSGKQRSRQRAHDAAEAVRGVHERHARGMVTPLNLYPLRVHGDIGQTSAAADQHAGQSERQRRGGQPAERKRKKQRKGAEAEHRTAAPARDEPGAAAKRGQTGHAEAEQDKAYLGIVRSGLRFERGQARGQQTVDKAGTDEEIRAGRAGLAELGPFHDTSLP